MAARTEQPDAVSAYVQMRLARMHDTDGMQLKAIAERAKVSDSQPSQVLSGKLGIGEKLLPKYATLLGFRTTDELREAAYQWWLDRRRQAVPDLTPAMLSAREKLLRYERASAAELDSILEAFRHPRFRNRSADWWLDTIAAELREDQRGEDPRDSESRVIAASQ